LELYAEVVNKAFDEGVPIDTAIRMMNIADWRPNPSNPRGAGRKPVYADDHPDVLKLKQVWEQVRAEGELPHIPQVIREMELRGTEMSPSTLRRHIEAMPAPKRKA
jgi:hypothetical protein